MLNFEMGVFTHIISVTMYSQLNHIKLQYILKFGPNQGGIKDLVSPMSNHRGLPLAY